MWIFGRYCENWVMFWRNGGLFCHKEGCRKAGMLFACGGLDGSQGNGGDGLNDFRDVFKTRVSMTFSDNDFQLTLFSAIDFSLYIQTPLCSGLILMCNPDMK